MIPRIDKPEEPAVVVTGDQLSIHFDDFSLESYRLFLKAKRLPEYNVTFNKEGETYTITAPARFASMLGVDVPPREVSSLPLLPALFDDQDWIVQTALDVKRFACWSDCGLGKTLIGLEWGRHVSHRTDGGRVLIVTLNDVVRQWVDAAVEFYGESLPVARLDSREQMKEWCKHGTIDGVATVARIAVTNYEKFNHTDPADQVVSEIKFLAGVVLDESSRLKTGGGKQKWAIIKSCRGVEYKLSETATPAPNELMEFASQASFLEKMRAANSLQDAAQQIIWTYFTRHPKTHRWTIKEHARAAFFEWMSSWSIYIRDPRRYGWRKGIQVPPPPEYILHTVPMTDAQRELVMEINSDPTMVPESKLGSMFAEELNAIATNRLSQAAKGFQYTKEQYEAEEATAVFGGGEDELGRVADPVDEESPEGLREGPEPEGAGDTGGGEDDGGGQRGADRVGGDFVRGREAEPTVAGEGSDGRRGRGGRRIKRRTVVRHIDSNKPKYVADLICGEAADGKGRGLQTLVWTVFNEEGEILAKLLKGAPFTFEVISGSTSEDDRTAILERFRTGETRVLIGKAAMLGFGMNLQHVGSMIFNGWTFSYEAFYQAVRRAYRHGQTRVVRVHVPVVRELEGQMWDAITRKQRQHEEAVLEMEQNYIRALGLDKTAAAAAGEQAA